MDPHSFIARAEAQRWIGIAEKLLVSNDFVGSKTFAIRARESDPRLEAADQILAIADTLLAAEKRVVGNNGVQQPDFYAILQLVRFVQDTDHIAAQYRRLAVVLNPNQNRFPYAEQAFQVVNEAYTVLSNPMRKSMYDAELDLQQQQQQMNNLGFNLEQQQHHQQQQQQQHQQQQHQHNFFSINRLGTSREQELPDQFQSRVQQQQLHQHNFLSQNPVRPVPIREQDQLFQRDHEQLFHPVQPFQVTTASQQQTRPQPHPPLQSPQQISFSWPQAPLLEQMQQEQQPRVQPTTQAQPQAQTQTHQQFRHNQQETQQEESVQEEPEPETETADENVDDSPSFWTACPYCLYMYEYPREYVECVLRCVTCKRAFQAVRISSPPPVVEGQDSYFYCWGFYPLAVSISNMENNNGSTQTNSNWAPFSPMCDVSSQVQDHLNYRPAPKKANQYSGPTIYIDDEIDDIFEGISEPSEDSSSDHDWNTIKKKKAKIIKKDRARDVRNGNIKNGSFLPVPETRRRGSGVTTRRQSVRAAKELGRLDLNVEFNNNEGEEATARTGGGHRGNAQGDGDNIEGIGFFEGLDEFFSSLPILSVVSDEKVKAA